MNLNSHGLNLPDSSNMNSEGLGIKGPTFLIFFLMNDNSKKKKKKTGALCSSGHQNIKASTF